MKWEIHNFRTEKKNICPRGPISVYVLMPLVIISKDINEKVLSARLIFIVNKLYAIMKIVSPNGKLIGNI